MQSFSSWLTASKQKPKDVSGAGFFHTGELPYK